MITGIYYNNYTTADFEVMCMFKALHKDATHVGQHQPLSSEEFYNFYEVQDMRWKEVSHLIGVADAAIISC